MLRHFLATVSLCLIAVGNAHGQVANGADLEARALRDLGEYLRDARLIYSLPGPSNPVGVDLIGPPRLQITAAPVCSASILTVHYEEEGMVGSEMSGQVRGFSTRTIYRLAADNDGSSLRNSLVRACEDALSDRRSRWFTADFDAAEWALMYESVWKASALLVAIQLGEASYENVDIAEFSRRADRQALQALHDASAREISRMRMRPCAENPSADCRIAELAWGNELTLQVTYRRLASDSWAAMAVEARWSDLAVVH